MQIAAEMSQNEQFPEITNKIFSRLFELYGVLDTAGRVITMSGSIFERTSTDPELLRNQVFSETAFWQSSEANSRAVISALKKAVKGEFVRLNAAFRISSKEKQPLELTFLPVEEKQCIVVSARAIERPQRKTKAADETASNLLFAAETAGIGLWYLKVDQGVIRSTRQFSEILGLKHGEDVRFASFLEAVHPDDRARVKDLINDAIRSDDHFEHSFRMVSD